MVVVAVAVVGAVMEMVLGGRQSGHLPMQLSESVCAGVRAVFVCCFCVRFVCACALCVVLYALASTVQSLT